MVLYGVFIIIKLALWIGIKKHELKHRNKAKKKWTPEKNQLKRPKKKNNNIFKFMQINIAKHKQT